MGHRQQHREKRAGYGDAVSADRKGMKAELSPAKLEEYELASENRVSEELCDKIAFRFAQKTASAANLGMVRLLYEEIVMELRCLRPSREALFNGGEQAQLGSYLRDSTGDGSEEQK